jgi:hypothetical protein
LEIQAADGLDCPVIGLVKLTALDGDGHDFILPSTAC